jgi:hypothetical protein
MIVRFFSRAGVVTCLYFGLLFGAGCERPRQTPVEALGSFTVTSAVVDGISREVLESANGMSLYFTSSNLVVWFNDATSIVIEFDPETLNPKSLLLDIPPSAGEPGKSVADLNADGVPEVRRIHGKPGKEVFYRGEWYTAQAKGTNSVITISGTEIEVRFDGHRIVEVQQ